MCIHPLFHSRNTRGLPLHWAQLAIRTHWALPPAVDLLVGVGEGNSNPLQYSCLENPMDRGAWWATIHRVAKSRTRLSNFCVCVWSGTYVSWFLNCPEPDLESLQCFQDITDEKRLTCRGRPSFFPRFSSHPFTAIAYFVPFFLLRSF